MAYKNLPKSVNGRGFRAPVSAEDKRETFRQAHPWASYLGGFWGRCQPSQPGLYPIATRTGNFAGYREFILRKGQIYDALAGPNEPGWQGWIWSEPLPEPPKLPEDWYTAAPSTEELIEPDEVEA